MGGITVGAKALQGTNEPAATNQHKTRRRKPNPKGNQTLTLGLGW